jgi:hypothetical protein
MALIYNVDYGYLENIESKDEFNRCEEYDCTDSGDLWLSVKSDIDNGTILLCAICFTGWLTELTDEHELIGLSAFWNQTVKP